MRETPDQIVERIAELTTEIRARMYKETDVTPCDVAHILEMRKERDKLVKLKMMLANTPDMSDFDRWCNRIIAATFIIMLIGVLILVALSYI